ncbi:MAG: 50S ribosomal protein L19 [Candidatus Yonathbacteria bacterium RIFOXYC1_FULL_52_10]|uniref:50S ribosomal protein L19 n=1 Tax=Candidatus Yonathbacteria bacterium RIFOXYD1_FULL_52_36 TaxID=1802730 RepID=A0A1G2SMY9_9BACT|nr:MAG: 50S ribosomal protein L19 [Candidatus Yonathbacteria bacterium RIFOXYC1_FULL_52_10]OHA86058.1 MAG: 50S ribosomal protein L19 [Candidatus Yonathbacteria bacterium RIFOXYD1_FULL_52_36]
MTILLSPVPMAARAKLDIRAGDTVRVSLKIEEKGKTRLQAFEGLVIAVKHGKEMGGNFTVRKVASGVGVEKTLPIYSPSIEKVEVLRRSKVRRSKLYFIREKVAREISRKMRNMRVLGREEVEEEVEEAAEEAAVEAAEAIVEAEVAPAEASAESEETPAEEKKED